MISSPSASTEFDENEAKDEGDEREWGEGHQYV